MSTVTVPWIRPIPLLNTIFPFCLEQFCGSFKVDTKAYTTTDIAMRDEGKREKVSLRWKIIYAHLLIIILLELLTFVKTYTIVYLRQGRQRSFN